MNQDIHDSIDRLCNYFRNVDIGPPASSENLDALKTSFAYIPEEVESFYSTFDGISVGIDDNVSGEILDLGFSLSQTPMPYYYDDPEQYLPIQSDGCGSWHCLVLRSGFGAGSVIFLDHEVDKGPAYLLAGSLHGYFGMWTDHLIFRHDRDGRMYPECRPVELDKWPWLSRPKKDHPWPFDLEWMKENDPAAQVLIEDPRFLEWIRPEV
ncbi:MAG: SMI1/KNR4 family protein [Planctomycetaceae bacterium]|nr:SMI1/KNR4 family protein [Planctomycetaceae bacterium]